NQPDAEVTFTRAGTDVARFSTDRPQTPKPPFDYKVEEVAFDNPFERGVRLAGTLTLPEEEGPFPAAILISGSGANDRDDTELGHKPFAVIADYLTRQGIAVLRTDDRGVGGSTGDFAAATSADLATDADAAARYLMTRPEIRRDAIGFIGHSEGGVIAPIAMASNKHIAFLVMLAGPGTRWDEMLLSQRRLIGLTQGKSEQELGRSEPLVAAVYRAIARARTEDAGIAAVRSLLTPEAMAALGVAGEDKDLVARRMNSRWTRYLFRHDPAPNLRKIRVPVLAMTGTLDLQIPADENLPAIRAALINSPDVTVEELPGLNHMFQTAKTGAPGEYADIQETFAPAALDVMTDWLAKRFVRPESHCSGSACGGRGEEARARGPRLRPGAPHLLLRWRLRDRHHTPGHRASPASGLGFHVPDAVAGRVASPGWLCLQLLGRGHILESSPACVPTYRALPPQPRFLQSSPAWVRGSDSIRVGACC